MCIAFPKIRKIKFKHSYIKHILIFPFSLFVGATMHPMMHSYLAGNTGGIPDHLKALLPDYYAPHSEGKS